MGLVFVSLLDFLLFIGVKLNYFDFYDIKEYFNIIFVDNQNFYYLGISFFVVGYLMLYSKYSKIFDKIYILAIIIALFSIYEPIGKRFGEMMLMSEAHSFKIGRIIFEGDLLYKGRTYTYIYRRDLNKTIKVENSDIKTLAVIFTLYNSLFYWLFE